MHLRRSVRVKHLHRSLGVTHLCRSFRVTHLCRSVRVKHLRRSLGVTHLHRSSRVTHLCRSVGVTHLCRSVGVKLICAQYLINTYVNAGDIVTMRIKPHTLTSTNVPGFYTQKQVCVAVCKSTCVSIILTHNTHREKVT